MAVWLISHEARLPHLSLIHIWHWFEHLFIGFFSYLIILTGISAVLFIIGWIKLKRDVLQIKKAIALSLIHIFHHAVADGFHLSRFFTEVQELTDSLATGMK